jgi:AhpD family alkylhydroperoxidase
VAASAAESLLERLHAAGVAEAAAIGRVVGAGSGRVFLRTDGRRTIPSSSKLEQQPVAREANNMACCDPSHQSDCCTSDAIGGVAVAKQKFQEFLQAAGAPGALDAKTKQAIAIALSVLARCEPCVKSHVKKARAMGFSQEEIDEAAWMGIGFGGSPAMTFYSTHGKS